MENNIMANEEVVEATEEIATTKTGKAVKVAAIIGATALAGRFIYKHVVKKIVAKVKAKKVRRLEGLDLPEPTEEEMDEYDNLSK